MYFANMWAVLGFLGFSMAVPLKQPYNPKDFYPQPHIVGGSEAPEGVSPYMVALLMGEWMTIMMCGGSIVSQQCVLTAAHCIADSLGWDSQLLDSFRGSIGTNRWADESKSIRFSGYKIHSEYDRFFIKNDVGILMTKKRVPMSDDVAVIPLNHNFIRGGEEVYVTGWGRTSLGGPVPDSLQKLTVTTLSPQGCDDAIREAQQWWGHSPNVNSTVEICTIHKLGAGQGLCHGDSGSALFDQLGSLVGIVSWGFPCAVGVPDILVRISAFYAWVHDVIETMG